MDNINTIDLIDHMGSDKLHGLAAWSSTFLEFGVDPPDDPSMKVDALVDHILNNGKKKRSIEDLLNFLAQNEHNSPFRFSSFVFGMTTDIATHIQKLKHRVILEAENGESGRYKELKEDKFYIPSDFYDVPVDKEIKGFEECNNWGEVLNKSSELNNSLYHTALSQMIPVLGRPRAKESSRYFKMYNSQINTMNKFSFDGIVQFCHKRNTEFAQREIAEIAQMMLGAVKNIPNNPFELSLKAFNL